MRNFDADQFHLDLSNMNWNDTLKLELNNPNLSFNSFSNSLNSLINKHIPLRRVTKKEKENPRKPWITNEILYLIKKRERLYKKFIQAKDENIKNSYQEQHRLLRNRIVSISRDSKKNYYQTFFEDNANNLKNTWKGIREIIKIRKQQHSSITSLNINNDINDNPYDIANSFNKYFTTIADNLQNSIYDAGKGYKKYLKNRNPNSFFVRPTNREEILEIIDGLQKGKASGPFSIPEHLLEMIKHDIAKPLADITNISFETGIYFDKLKVSKVIPIFKNKESMLDCENYRPISLLSNVNKIIEKLMYNRLYDFLERFDCIYRKQFGFRQKHSTAHALISMTEEIRHSLDNNLNVCGIFLDFQKAFDTVDHSILLDKLEFYGIRGIPLNWFKSYLFNRQQFVSINGTDSKIMNLPHGVPQGSILGPLLFLIYINDLHNSCLNCSVTHFADDTNLIIKNKSESTLAKKLNQDLKSLTKWLRANKISLNAKKTEFIIFESKWKRKKNNLKIKLDGKKLIPSSFIKYLGIFIDKHLDWSIHSDFISSKLSRSIGMLAKLKKFLPQNQLRSVYFSIFSSHMNYASIVWGQNLNAHIKRIVKLQNKALRVINFAPYDSDPLNLYYNAKILKFSDNIKLQNCLFVYDDINNLIPKGICNSFKPVQDSHNYRTRGSDNFKMEYPKIKKITHGKFSIKYRSVEEWNNLIYKYPNESLSSKSRPLFKKFVLNKLIEKYNSAT